MQKSNLFRKVVRCVSADEGKDMRKCIRMLILAAHLALTLSLAAALPAFAVNSGPTCTFEKGTTMCTTIHGSTDTHNGQVGSSGKDTGGGSGKVTGSDHTIL
jgi:hypothetical protein